MRELIALTLNIPIQPLSLGIVRRHTCARAGVLASSEFLLAPLGDGPILGAVGVGGAVCEGVYVAAEGFAYALYTPMLEK
jgi:hypothetical protein